MDRAYWEKTAGNYAADIFSVLGNDSRTRIVELISHLAAPQQVAADFGCGPGQLISLLSEHFSEIHACDWSPALLQEAAKKSAENSHVSFHEFDLSGEAPPPFAPVDLGLCINALIGPDVEERQRIWHTVTDLIAASGKLLLVVPSHESALFTSYRRLDWNLRAGLDGKDAETQSHESDENASAREQGVRPIDGVPTKHFLKEELEVQFRDLGFENLEFEKLPYPWTTEFDDPPEWMAEPNPWHWLVVASR